MTEIQTFQTIIHQWVLQQFPLAKQQTIQPDDLLLEHGIVDSLGILEIVQFLEEEFGIEITDEEMIADHFESVASIARLVESKKLPASGM